MPALILQVLLFLLPWAARRLLLQAFFGYKIHPTARIGYTIIQSRRLRMAQHSAIRNLTFIRGLDEVSLGENARLGSLNWITALPSGNTEFFSQLERRPSLTIEDHAAVTNRHLIDCTDEVSIGEFATLAGWGSQIVSHSIDPKTGRQDAQPVRVGRYCFVGTRVILLKGCSLPDHSILAAGSVLNRAHADSHGLYSGVPAMRVRELSPDMAYFKRDVGRVI